MKNLILFISMISILSSCDPTSSMDANIKNSTSQNLSIIFRSSDVSLNETFQIDPNETILFQDGFSVGDSVLEPRLTAYDSIYIKNESNEIVKVYKQKTEGKNIFNVDDYWRSSEPSKRYYKYNYEINNEDIE
jgi:hypothetical protein